jgi:uncharacterized protein with PQ loop repeat
MKGNEKRKKMNQQLSTNRQTQMWKNSASANSVFHCQNVAYNSTRRAAKWWCAVYFLFYVEKLFKEKNPMCICIHMVWHLSINYRKWIICGACIQGAVNYRSHQTFPFLSK